MTTFIKILGIVFCLLSSNFVFATYIRSIDVDNYDLYVLNCYGAVSETCINNVCLTSDERDCQDVCRQLAADRCQVDRDDWILNWPN